MPNMTQNNINTAIDGLAGQTNNFTEELTEHTEAYAENIKQYIKEHPMTALGLAVGAGILIGFLLEKAS